MIPYKDRYIGFRKSFRKYPVNQILNACIGYIYSEEKEPLDGLKKKPWLILLFMKWVLLDGVAEGKKGRQLTPETFNRMLFQLNEYFFNQTHVSYSNHVLMIRNVAYQQFSFQRSVSSMALSRQWRFFTKVDGNHFFRSAFKTETGLEIERYLAFCMVLVGHFILTDKQINPVVSPHSFLVEGETPTFTEEEVRLFLDSLSISCQNASKHFDRNSKYLNEVYETSAFFQRPLLKNLNGTYTCVHPMALFRALESIVYKRLKQHDSTKFAEKFNVPIFERYIEEGLSYAKSNYWDEKRLKEEFGWNGKVVDFAIFEDDAIVLVDAKAVEMREHGKSTFKSAHVFDCVVSAVT